MKKKKRSGRLLCLVLTAAIALGLAVPALAVEDEDSGHVPIHIEKIGERLDAPEPSGAAAEEEPLPDMDEVVRVTVVMEKPAALAAGFQVENIALNQQAVNYRSQLRADQDAVTNRIEREVLDGGKLDVVWNMTLTMNAVSVNVPRRLIDKIAAVDGVKQVIEERIYHPQVVTAGGELQPNMAVSGQMNGSQAAWLDGYTGAGTKIAVIDSGLDIDHEAFDPDAFQYALSQLEDFDEDQLMDESDLNAVLSQLHITENAPDLTADDLYQNAKVPFGFNYKDFDTNLSHLQDTQSPHGSHVAGIAAANRFVKAADGSYVDALEAVKSAGNAPDAQVLVMKVFGVSGAGTDSDIVVAIEDALTLGADVINLSLGGVEAGLVTAYTEEQQKVYDDIISKNTLMVVAAGNNGAWSEATSIGDLYSDGVNFDTVGPPASYSNAFSVASVENDGVIGAAFQVNGKSYGFMDNMSSFKKPSFATLDKSSDGSGTEYSFVMVGAGMAGKETQSAQALADKVDANTVVILWRGGGVSFPDKANAFGELNPAGVIIVNDKSGVIEMDLNTFKYDYPVVLTTRTAGQEIWAAGTPATATADDGTEITYITGKLTVKGSDMVSFFDSDCYQMSVFSSWGVPGDLSINPEIAAPGGNIYSVYGAHNGGSYVLDNHNSYTTLSGTSMASPQIAGMSALVQQYIRESGVSVPGLNDRALTQSLLMSTAKPMKEDSGLYFPVLQQGAGLANVSRAVSSPVTLTVKGIEDGKVKAQLGDDPARNGRYGFTFTFHNLTDEEQRYSLSADVFTQLVEHDDVLDADILSETTRAMDASVRFTGTDGVELVTTGSDLEKYDFTGDGVTDVKDAQLLLDHINLGDALLANSENADVNGGGDVSSYDAHLLLKYLSQVVTVPAGGSVTVNAVITLSDAEKARLAEENPTGAYVEAYVTAQAVATQEGVLAPDLGIPVLAYYGSWSEPSMFELGTAAEWIADMNTDYDSYDAEMPFEREPYFWYNISTGTNGLFVNGDMVADGDAVLYDSLINRFKYTLVRNAGDTIVRIRWVDDDGVTQTRWTESDGAQPAVYNYGGQLFELSRSFNLNRFLTDQTGLPFPDGRAVEFTLMAAPEYYAKYGYDWEKLTNGVGEDGELGEGAMLHSTVVVDSEFPEIVEGDDKTYFDTDEQGDYNIHVTVKDSVSVASVALYAGDDTDPAYRYSETDFDFLEDTPNFTRTGPGEERTLDFLGSYMTMYDSWVGPFWALDADTYTIEVADTVGHVSVYRIWVDVDKTYEATGSTISDSSIKLPKGKTAQLTARVQPASLENRDVVWTSSDEAVASVSETGLVTGLSGGTATITATSVATDAEGNTFSASCEVEVTEYKVTGEGVYVDNFVYNPKFFRWDLETGNQYSGSGLDLPGQGTWGTVSIANIDEDTFYLFSDQYHLYVMNKADGSVKETYEWDMSMPWAECMAVSHAYREGGLSYTYGDMIFVEQPPEEMNFESAFNFNDQYHTKFPGLAAVEREWEATYNGEEYSGGLILMAVDTKNQVYTLYVYEAEEDDKLGALVCIDQSDIDLTPTTYYTGLDDFYVSNMVLGEDGALYYSFHTGNYYSPGNPDRSNFYRLTYDEEKGTWHGEPLGNLGASLYPCQFYEVKSNDGTITPINLPDPSKADENQVERSPYDRDNVDGNTAGGPAGALNSVDVSGDEGHTGVSTGITVDADSGTVTVPVKASDSTNGTFTLSYDPSVLQLKSAGAGDAVISVKTSEGQVKIVYASGKVLKGETVASVEFGFQPVEEDTVTQIVLSVTEDESDDGFSGFGGRTENQLPGDTVYSVTLVPAVCKHPAEAVQHVEAKAATRAAEGNIEYWYCSDCGKYFKDAALTEEITLADTVIPKLTAPSGSGVVPSAPGGSGAATPEPDVTTSGDETVATPGSSASGGTATVTIPDDMGSEMVRQAKENGSSEVIIDPEYPEGVTGARVNIPGSTITGLASAMLDDLRIKTPAGDVIIPPRSLAELSGTGDVTVTVDKAGDSVSMTVSAGGNGVDVAVKAALALSGGQVAVLVGKDGTETILPKSLVEGNTLYLLLHTPATVKLIDNSQDFTDVSSSDWFASNVEFVSSHELFNGTGGGAFSPKSNMNRAMLATVLWRLENQAAASGESFSDVASGMWYSDGVAWAASNGVVSGVGDGLFRPDRDVTRQEMAVMIYNYAKYAGLDLDTTGSLSGYSDASDVSDWAKDAMGWAVANGIFRGTGTGLNPTGTASRAEVAAVLQRLVGLIVK